MNSDWASEEPEWVQDCEENWDLGLGSLMSLYRDSTDGGWSQARWPDEEVGPEGGRISRHIVQALAGMLLEGSGWQLSWAAEAGRDAFQAVVVPGSCGWKRFGSGRQIGVGWGACGRWEPETVGATDASRLFPPPPLSVILLFYLHNQYRECFRKPA